MNTADHVQVVTFRLGSQEFAFDILQIERIVRYELPAPLPKAPEFLEGVMPYAGGAVPVVILDSVRRFAPRDDLIGATVGFAMQGNSVGLIVGPAAAGELAAAFGWQAIGPLVIAFVTAACALVVCFGRRDTAGRAGRG